MLPHFTAEVLRGRHEVVGAHGAPTSPNPQRLHVPGPAKCVCVSLPEDILCLFPSLPTMWAKGSLGEVPPLPGSVLSWDCCVLRMATPPLVPAVCDCWAPACFLKVISVRLATVGVFTAWKWADIRACSLSPFPGESLSEAHQCRTCCVPACPCLPGFLCRIQLQLSRVVTHLMVRLPLPALPHPFHFPHRVAVSSQINHPLLHSSLRVSFWGSQTEACSK